MQAKEALAVRLLKEFPVPAEQLYRAWVSPEALKQWWHPMDNTLKEAAIDVKKGGAFRYVFENSNNGHAFQITGEYFEVKENERLVYSWNWQIPDKAVEDSSFRLTISFSPTVNGSRLEVVQENFSNEESVYPHRQGWEKALDDLHQYLTKAL